MRPASATDTVETDTHFADLSTGVIEARSAAARSSFDDRRKPTTPSRCELTDAWRASRHPMRSRVGARRSLGLWQTETRRACAPPMPCAGVVFPSHDREADPRDVPVAARSMRPHRFSRCLEGSGVVDRSAKTAAFRPTREGRTTRSIRDVFHRTISPERRFVAEDALDADALSHRLATMRSHTGFLTSPRRIYTGLRRSRLGPTGSCARRLAAP